MNSFVKTMYATVCGIVVILMSGCVSSSNLVDIWHDASYQAPTLGKILVVAIRKDAAMRRLWEDAFTESLVKHDVATISSYTLFPDSLPDTSQVARAVQENGFDGVLVVMRRPSQTNKHYVPGYTSVDQKVRYVSYWQRYVSYSVEIEHPGYVDSQKVDVRSIDVTTTGNNGHLIWSATSKTPDPGSVSDVQTGIVDLVTKDLIKYRIIKPLK